MEDTSRLVVGRYRQNEKKPNCIHVEPETTIDVLTMKITYDDVEEAVARYFIDDLGFLSKTFKIKDLNNGMSAISLSAEVEFVDEGIVMAKLHGILE